MNKVPRFSFLISHNPLFSKIYFHIFLTAHLSYFSYNPDISVGNFIFIFRLHYFILYTKNFVSIFDFLLSYLVRIDSVFDF